VATVLVADTQILVWYVREPSRLTTTAVESLETATANGDVIGVSALSIVELVFATEKATNRVPNADPGDRIIVATAEVLGLTLGSDSKIPSMASLSVVW
jgi:PIN domain nuclease of toxin-antitoxin system